MRRNRSDMDKTAKGALGFRALRERAQDKSILLLSPRCQWDGERSWLRSHGQSVRRSQRPQTSVHGRYASILKQTL